MKTRIVMAGAFVALVASVSVAASISEQMSAARLDMDRGKLAEAAAAFLSVGRDGDVVPATRCEALAWLGQVRKMQGDDRGAVQAFREGFLICARDREGLRPLVGAVTGVEQDPETWRGRTDEVALVVIGDDPEHPVATVVYGDAATIGTMTGTGDPISLDLKNAEVRDTLRLFAEISGMSMVVAEGVGGTITLNLKDVPWDAALELILASQGLEAKSEGGVLRIDKRAR